MKLIKFNDLPEHIQVKELRREADRFLSMVPDGKYTDDQAINICLAGMSGNVYIKSLSDYFKCELKQIEQ